MHEVPDVRFCQPKTRKFKELRVRELCICLKTRACAQQSPARIVLSSNIARNDKDRMNESDISLD